MQKKEHDVLENVIENLNNGVSVRLQKITKEDFVNYIKPLSLLTASQFYMCVILMKMKLNHLQIIY